MTPFIDLQRRFRDLTAAELETPEILASLNDHGYGLSTGWAELLKHRRILLLAEAGAGKTREMIEQRDRLVAEGKFAFFIALESLDRDDLVASLSTDEEESFNAWKANGRASAWFFLDAVDELKLTEGKLDRALHRFSKAISGHLDCAHIIISCRPIDWRPDIDLATVEKRIPLPLRRPNPAPATDDLFLKTLRRERNGAATDPKEDEDLPNDTTIRTVVLLPMSANQIKLFAERVGVQNAPGFLAEIDRKNAWMFARRPLDLSELIATWTSIGHLGTRLQQHEANIGTKLKDDPDRSDRGVLIDDKARLGAERLALALALTRTRTIKSPEQSLDAARADGVLDSADILRDDWTQNERQALLRRALFDPATYGRVRFHHRSVQEYLAARRLKALRDRGMSTKALFRLLFAEVYGEKVVIPSMKPISAWLALWDDSVRRELTQREPEALLSLGDPESLTIAARIALLRSFVNAYGEGSWRGVRIPIDEVRRLADPGLAPTIRELWGNGPANTDVRELLIEIIWQGPVEACADLARTVAFDPTWNGYHRVAAVRALIACGHQETVRKIAEAILSHPPAWSDKVVYGLAGNLFPDIISVDELVVLLKRIRETRESIITGIDSVLHQIIEVIDPATTLAIELRDKVADLIWLGRNAMQEPYRIRGRFDKMSTALATLCERQLADAPRPPDASLLRACVIASRFSAVDSVGREPIGKLRARFCEEQRFRESAFWTELAFMDEVVPEKVDWHRFNHAEHDSLIGQLQEADRPWLEATLAETSSAGKRPVALHALLDLWNRRGRIQAEADALRALIENDTELQTILTERTAPPTRNIEMEKIESDFERRKQVAAEREAQRLQNWRNWRERLLVDPDTAFAPENELETIANFYTWLNLHNDSHSKYSAWNGDALAEAFGPSIAEKAAIAFKVLWRKTPPRMYSTRTAEEGNGIPYVWLYALSGVSAEATIPGWAARLTSDEARIAAAYATVEINGLAPFITDLVSTHPAEVDAILGEELINQIKLGGEHGYLPLLQDLTQADIALKRLLAPRLFDALVAWPRSCSAESRQHLSFHLEYVLRILFDASDETTRVAVADECERRYKVDPFGSLAMIWLRGLFRFDSERGTRELTERLATGNAIAHSNAVDFFAGLFGGHDDVVFEINDPAIRARALGTLVRSAYACVRHEDDQTHEGCYNPDTRDRAETARNFLLSKLLDTPGAEARRVILELAEEPDFAHFPDRLRLLARGRAATDAEFAPLDPSVIVTLESRYEVPPGDRDTLFEVMMDHLDDLALDIAHDDFTDRRTLRRIQEEVEMQRTLARRIRDKANGAFVVTREDEVADQKRTDIRLLAVRGDQKCVIEVKLADTRWSLTDLEHALRAQLVGQYLRHATCKAGCLLLTYDGRKKFWTHPVTCEHLEFDAMVAYLNEKAKDLEAESAHCIRLGVFGLDLTDPMLEPAHKK